MARTSTPPKPIATDLVVPLDPADANYRKRFVRIDGTRCLALGSRSARWLEGDEPGALLDLGDGAYGSAPFVLPDGRVVLAGLEGFVVLDRTTATPHRYALESPLHVLPSGLSAGALLLTSIREAVAVWVDLDGRQRAVVDARDRGCVVAGGGTAYVLRTAEGVLHLERHDGATTTTASVPWEGTDEGSPFYRGVGVTGASAHGDRLVVTHHGLAAIAHWRGDAARRIDTAARIADARVSATHAVLRTAGNPPSIVCLDAQGDARWTTATERYTSLQLLGGRAFSMSRKGECVLVLDLRTGAEEFRGALPLARADDLYEGMPLGFAGGVVLCPARLSEPQKHAWLLLPDRAPQKLAHPGLGGAVAWGDAGFATWGDPREAAVTVKRWTV